MVQFNMGLAITGVIKGIWHEQIYEKLDLGSTLIDNRLFFNDDPTNSFSLQKCYNYLYFNNHAYIIEVNAFIKPDQLVKTILNNFIEELKN